MKLSGCGGADGRGRARALRESSPVKLKHIDHEREFDWGNTSPDYARYRAGYPESFYEVLAALGIGKPGQTILDLGTGTGVLARAFAKRGARVTGVDISANQIDAAQVLAAHEGLDISFHVSAAEDVAFPGGSFEVISAGQSWLYFDAAVMIPKVLRLLVAEGCLVLTHLAWLPHQDSIAQQTEELVLRYNPGWTGAGYKGNIPPVFPWAKEYFDLRTFHVMHAPLSFTRETWRGRIRACRGIGASLGAEEAGRRDRRLDRLRVARFPLGQFLIGQLGSRRELLRALPRNAAGAVARPLALQVRMAPGRLRQRPPGGRLRGLRFGGWRGSLRARPRA
jgi:SAM-dependent methyltransferase